MRQHTMWSMRPSTAKRLPHDRTEVETQQTAVSLRVVCGSQNYMWSDVRRISLKIAQKCCLYLYIFSCVKINVFRSFFAFILEMHVRCDNEYKTGEEGGNIFGQPNGCCLSVWLSSVLSPMYECEVRGYLIYLLIVKYLSHRFCVNSATVY